MNAESNLKIQAFFSDAKLHSDDVISIFFLLCFKWVLLCQGILRYFYLLSE